MARFLEMISPPTCAGYFRELTDPSPESQSSLKVSNGHSNP